MDAFQAMMTRRSIRRFTSETVRDEDIRKILEAGMMAPTARNYQPWCFIVIRERKLLDVIPEINPHAKMLREAPMAILVCGDSEKEKEESYILQGCSAAIQNILLAAHSLDLGAVWIGIHPRQPRIDGMRDLLHLPAHVQPVSLIALGHPAEEKTSKNRYDEKKVKHDDWNE